MQIFPTPKEYIVNSGSFSLQEKLYFHINSSFSNELFKSTAPLLIKSFTCNTSSLEIVEDIENENTAFITYGINDCVSCIKTHDFDYTLKVDKTQVSIAYKDDISLIHAFLTFLMTIETVEKGSYESLCCMISDKPSLKFRCAHLCVFPETSLDFLRKCVLLCAMYKYTHVVIEFWGMYKYSFTDALSWKQAYTYDEIKPIIDEMRALGVQPVPMLNLFGHASQSRVMSGKHVTLDQYPEMEYMFESDGWSWRVDDEEVYGFLEKAVCELCSLFADGDYFHFGCDEVYSIKRKENPADFLSKHFDKIARTARKLGRKPLLWGDMLLGQSKVGNTLGNDICDETHLAINSVPKDIIICDWQYFLTKGICETAEYFKSNGFGTVLCPWCKKENIRFLCKEAGRLGLNGIMLTTWHTVMESFGVFAYAAEYMWDVNASDTYKPYETVTATLVRKLAPCNGDYEKAGWVRDQLTYNRD